MRPIIVATFAGVLVGIYSEVGKDKGYDFFKNAYLIQLCNGCVVWTAVLCRVVQWSLSVILPIRININKAYKSLNAVEWDKLPINNLIIRNEKNFVADCGIVSIN